MISTLLLSIYFYEGKIIGKRTLSSKIILFYILIDVMIILPLIKYINVEDSEGIDTFKTMRISF